MNSSIFQSPDSQPLSALVGSEAMGIAPEQAARWQAMGKPAVWAELDPASADVVYAPQSVVLLDVARAAVAAAQADAPDHASKYDLAA